MQYLLTAVIGVIVLKLQAAELFDLEKENSLIPNGNLEENSRILANCRSTYLNESNELSKNYILPSSNVLACSRKTGNDNINNPLLNIDNEMAGDVESQSDEGSAVFKKIEDNLPPTPPILKIHKSESKHSLINRDLDTFYDNDLFDKMNYDENFLKNVQVDSRNGDSYLSVKDQNRINKRESKSSNQSDYINYYDNKSDETSVKEKFTNIKRIFQHKSKNNSECAKLGVTLKSTEIVGEIQSDKLKKDILKQTEATIVLKEKELRRDQSPNSATVKKAKNSYLNHSGITHKEIKCVGSAPLYDWSEEISKPDHKDESRIISEERSNNLLTKTSGRCEMGNCLPSGGLPKYQTLSFSPKKNDSCYEKVIQGDLVDKFHKTVLGKLNRNSRMTNELGITPADTRDVRDLYNRIRCKDTYCCKKVIEELECFLTWILTVDTSRKKRSSYKVVVEDTGNLSESSSNKIGPFESYINDYTLSPEYKKLFANVEKYKESSANSWNYDSFNLLSDSSKK